VFELLEERIGKSTWFETGRGYYQPPPRRHNHHNETLQYSSLPLGAAGEKNFFLLFLFGMAVQDITLQIAYCIA
jgi:Uma2 family endonuclease